LLLSKSSRHADRWAILKKDCPNGSWNAAEPAGESGAGANPSVNRSLSRVNVGPLGFDAV
jgi:hypothetical protein